MYGERREHSDGSGRRRAAEAVRALRNAVECGRRRRYSYSYLPVVGPTSQRRSTRQLHNNYIVWCRHYAATLAAEEGPAPTGAPLLTDTHAK